MCVGCLCLLFCAVCLRFVFECVFGLGVVVVVFVCVLNLDACLCVCVFFVFFCVSVGLFLM